MQVADQLHGLGSLTIAAAPAEARRASWTIAPVARASGPTPQPLARLHCVRLRLVIMGPVSSRYSFICGVSKWAFSAGSSA